MAKPETTFYTSVHKHLPSLAVLHREKMANPYRGGTADLWYSGAGLGSSDLWVEYKFIVIPKRDSTIIDLCGSRGKMLSELQQEWLRSRYAEGRNVAVIVGCNKGGVVFTSPDDWASPILAGDFRERLEDRSAIAAWIKSKTVGRL